MNRILEVADHRPYPLPDRPWQYYQAWKEVLFVHWPLDPGVVQGLIPQGLELDVFQGEAWISIVVFEVEGLRPRQTPAFSTVSDFLELNVRTYVTRNGKPGIYFLHIEAEKRLSAWMAKFVTGMPYVKSEIQHEHGSYTSKNAELGFHFEARYQPLGLVQNKRVLDSWLTERYCVFHQLGEEYFGHDIHHLEWPLQAARVEGLQLHYQFGDLVLDRPGALAHYSKGVEVATWGKQKE